MKYRVIIQPLRQGDSRHRRAKSPNEFKQFIGKEMRLSQVEYAPKVDSQQILSFYMGKNTPERKDYITETWSKCDCE